MTASLPRRVKGRYSRRLARSRADLDELVEAIQALLKVASREDPQFLAHGLQLLVEHLHADQAALLMVSGQNVQAQWWVPEQKGKASPPCIPSLCQWLIENPFRLLVLKSVLEDGSWGKDPELERWGIQAVAGAGLREGGRVRGMVFLYYRDPHPFSRAELALLEAVAGYLGRILEIERLKSALGDLENSLAITRAVVEDSSIQDPATDLPNLRYLEIWLKANLPAAAREGEVITAAQLCLCPDSPEGLKRIRDTAERIRGGDLLVSMGRGQFLLLLRRAPKGLGQVFLNRMRQRVGSLPMGATLWIPGQDDLRLESVLRRLEQAMEESRNQPGHDLVWRLADH